MANRAVIYGRQSRTRDGSESLAVQVEACTAAAERLGLDVVETLLEPPSTSGYKNRGLSRGKFAELLQMIKGGDVDVVVVYKTDRLSRGGGPGWAPLVEAFEAAGQQIDKVVATPEGYMSEFEIGIRATMDREESKKTAERMIDMKARAAANGRPNGGGRRPFGYTDNKFRALIQDEVALLREARDRVVAGEPVNAVARDLTARGSRTSTGSSWSGQKLGRTLRSQHLAGIRRHGSKAHAGTWEPIFTKAEHEEILLAAGVHRPALVHRHLLTGFLLCGREGCGGNLHSKFNVVGPRYECNRCHKVTISAPFIEGLISEAVKIRLQSDEVRAALADASGNRSLREVSAKLTADQTALEQLSRDHYVDRIISRDVFLAAQQPLQAAVAEGQEKLARMRSTAVGAIADPIQAWDSGDIPAQQGVLKAMVRSITLGPSTRNNGRTPSADRVDVIWRA